MQKHIVIVEDDDSISLLLTTLLEENGYRVTAFPAVTSIEDLIALNPDCFILDEQLPFVSGHILCIVLKSKPQTKNTPVILISASDRLDTVASISEADASIKKPFDIGKLLQVVADLIR